MKVRSAYPLGLALVGGGGDLAAILLQQVLGLHLLELGLGGHALHAAQRRSRLQLGHLLVPRSPHRQDLCRTHRTPHTRSEFKE
jgi:hypothetical protein